MKTIDDIKSGLPEVQVNLTETKKSVTCRTAGRKGAFCQVYNPVTGQSWEFTWEAVARSINNGTPLMV